MIEPPWILAITMALQPSITLHHPAGPSFTHTVFEAGCRGDVIRFVVRYDASNRGRSLDRHTRAIQEMSVNGQTIQGATEQLERKAEDRVITAVRLVSCGYEYGNPKYFGYMLLSGSSQRRPYTFTIMRKDGRWILDS